MRTPLLTATLAVATSLSTPGAQSLTTTYAGGNAQDGNMFNLVALTDLTVDRFDIHFADELNPAPCGSACSVNEVELYSLVGGYAPSAMTPSDWTLLGSVQHTISTALGVPQPLQMPIDLPLDPVVVPKRAFYVTSTGDLNSITGLPNEFLSYTNGTGSGNTVIGNGELEFRGGTGNDYPFGTTFLPRTWNGTVYYTAQGACGSAVQAYCSAGTSAAGCQASLSTSGTASATSASGFFLHASGVEGQSTGVFLLGSGGPVARAWDGGSSPVCVALPLIKTNATQLNGVPGACDAALSFDLNDYWTAVAPGSNPGAGAQVQAQFFYRSPGSASPQAALSDAVDFTVCP